MNSVHLVAQEKYRVEPGPKQVECTECTARNQPSSTPGLAPSAQAARLPRPAAPYHPRLLPAQLPSLSVAIQFCIAIQFLPPAPLSSHNTSSVLRYTFCLAYPLPVAIQDLISQYNPLLNQLPSSHLGCNTNLVLQYNPPLAYSSCNTIWVVAQLKSAQIFFFSFFLIIRKKFIFSIFFFQQLEKSLKITKIIFFSFSIIHQINL